MHLAGAVHHFGGIEHLETHHAAVISEIGDDAGANLVTLPDARFAERDGEGVRLRVVFKSIVSPISASGDQTGRPLAGLNKPCRTPASPIRI